MATFDALFQMKIGRWFDEDKPLPVVGGKLEVQLSGTWTFKAPVPGFASVAIVPASGTPPWDLAPLRDGAGNAAFTANTFVVYLRILPAVEEVLAAKTPKRPVVRTLAIALAVPPDAKDLKSSVFWDLNVGGSTTNPSNKDIAFMYGLGLGSDGKLVPGDKPVQSMIQAGEGLLKVASGATLWAFDREGHALDPGAVAAWWNELLASNPSWAVSPTAGTQKVADGRTVHLVHPNDASMTSPALLKKLAFDGLSGQNTSLFRSSKSTVSVNVAAPTTDKNLRVAVFPDGSYGPKANVSWLNAPARDFVRVGVVDLEHILVGLDADTPLPTTDPQNNAATKVDIAANAIDDVTMLRINADDALNAIVDVLERKATETDTAWTVAPAISPSAGPVKLAPPAVAALPPSVSVEVMALVGASGQTNGTRIRGQRVLVKVSGCAAGAWVRVFPHRLDLVTGLRTRMLGGAARVTGENVTNASNFAWVVMTLPDGGVGGADLSCDVLVYTQRANGSLQSRAYVDQRFSRPTPVAGSPVTAVPTGATWCVCEMGKTGTGTSNIPKVPAGSTLVVLPSGSTPATLLTLPAAAIPKLSVVGESQSSDKLTMCAPAFSTGVGRTAADGRLEVGAPTATGLTGQVDITPRDDPKKTDVRSIAPTGLERLEVAALRTRNDATQGVHIVDHAAIGAVPLLAALHEPGQQRLGAPGAPPAEVHGTGVRLRGAAARLVAEHTRNRMMTTAELASHAWMPWSTSLSPQGAATPWVAVVRSGACSLDIEPNLLSDLETLVNNLVGALALPNNTSNINTAVQAIHTKLGLPAPAASPTAGQLASFVRALASRVQWAKNGAREAERSMAGAVARAERFIYIETPALTPTSTVVTQLKKRLADRPGLLVLIASSAAPRLGLPSLIADAERQITRKTITELVTAAPRRVVAFAPVAAGGRPVRLYSTTLIVDDMFAYTGTSHLSRRGLSFDGSLGMAVFDERLTWGRPREVRRFRKALVAERLGLVDALLPDDPQDLMVHVADEQARQGDRIARVPAPAKTEFTPEDLQRYDPSGAGPLASAGLAQLFNLVLGMQQGVAETEAVLERDELAFSS